MVGRVIDDRRNVVLVLIAAVMASVMAVGGTAYVGATVGPDDGPDATWADRQIEQVSRAGIATGYRDGSFKPDQDISRAEAAAWFNRSGGAADISYGMDTVSPSSSTLTVAAHDVESPAAGGSGGYLQINTHLYSATADPTGLGCPCAMDVYITVDGDEVIRSRTTVPGQAMDDESTETGPIMAVSLPYLLALPPGAEHRIELKVDLLDSDVGDLHAAGAVMTSYVPFGGTATEGYWPSNAPESGSVGGPISLVPGAG